MALGDVVNGFGQGLGQGTSLYNAMALAPLQRQELVQQIAGQGIENQQKSAALQQYQTQTPFKVGNQTFMLPNEEAAKNALGLGEAQLNAQALANRLYMGQTFKVGEETPDMKVQQSAAVSAVPLFGAYKTLYNNYQVAQDAKAAGNIRLANTIISQTKQQLASNPILAPYVAQLNSDGANWEVVAANLRAKIGGEYQKLNSSAHAEVPPEQGRLQGDQMLPPLNMPVPEANEMFGTSTDTFFGSKFKAAMDNSMNAADPMTGKILDPVIANQYANEQKRWQNLKSQIPADYTPPRDGQNQQTSASGAWNLFGGGGGMGAAQPAYVGATAIPLVGGAGGSAGQSAIPALPTTQPRPTPSYSILGVQ